METSDPVVGSVYSRSLVFRANAANEIRCVEIGNAALLWDLLKKAHHYHFIKGIGRTKFCSSARNLKVFINRLKIGHPALESDFGSAQQY